MQIGVFTKSKKDPYVFSTVHNIVERKSKLDNMYNEWLALKDESGNDIARFRLCEVEALVFY